MRDRKLRAAAFLVLGAFVFVLYSQTYDYILILERGTSDSFFLFDRWFLQDFLSIPGGLVLYAGHFCAQFYEHVPLGALVVAVAVVVFGVLLYGVLTRLMRTVALFCALLPCILLATALSYGILEIVAGLIAATGAFLVCLSLPEGLARRLYALLAIPTLYLLSGGCFWLFVLWVSAAEWRQSRFSANLVWKLLFPAMALATLLAAWRWLFLVPLSNAILQPTIFAQAHPWPAILLYGYLASLPFWTLFYHQDTKSPRKQKSYPRLGVLVSWWWKNSRAYAAAAVFLALLAVALPCFFYDPAAKELAAYQQLYKEQRWDDILRKARTTPSRELMPQFFTNCALYHKGQLLDEMFRYPQTWGGRGLILNSPRSEYRNTPRDDSEQAMYNSDLFFEMGHMNAAFLIAYEHMALYGRTYENVQRMAECSLVKGDCALARKYLTLLERTLYHRAQAREYMALLADPKARDLRFAEQRARLPTVELMIAMPGFMQPLTLLKSHPDNRMAFDYLMAWCLLDPQCLPMLSENIGCLTAAGYRSIPVHLQQAVMTLEKATGRPMNLQGFQCDEETALRFGLFLRQPYPESAASARAMQSAFGGTFMYYAAFVAPPQAEPLALSTYWGLANNFRSLGWTADAIAQCRRVLWLDPGFAPAHAALAELLKSQGLLEEAASEEREARRLASGAPPAGPRLRGEAPSPLE